jgi:hypothetical protein
LSAPIGADNGSLFYSRIRILSIAGRDFFSFGRQDRQHIREAARTVAGVRSGPHRPNSGA